MKKEGIETMYMKVKREGKILYCVFSDNLEIDGGIARHCVEARIAFSEGKSYPCLIDMKTVRTATKEAREYMAEEGIKCMTAGALLIGSPLSTILGNIFFAVNKPKIPTKLFTDEAEARKWLDQYII